MNRALFGGSVAPMGITDVGTSLFSGGGDITQGTALAAPGLSLVTSASVEGGIGETSGPPGCELGVQPSVTSAPRSYTDNP